MRIVDLGLARDRLAIGDLRRADIGVDLILAAQNIDLDVEMQFAHALQNGLPGLLVGGDAEGWVLGCQLLQGDAELLLVGLGFRLDRNLDDRIGKLHPLQNDRLGRIAKRITGADLLEAGKRDDVASKSFLDVLAIIRMHQQHASDTLFLVACGVQNAGARFQLARIDAAEGQRADERVVHDLEGQNRSRLIIGSPADGLFACLESIAFIGGTSIGDGR